MRLAAALLLSVVLAGCGWQLRGALTGLGGVPIAVETGRVSNAFAGDLRAGLSSAGAELAPRTDAAAVVILEEDVTHQRSVAVVGNARSREYELEYTLRYRVETPDGDLLSASEPVSRIRSYRYDATEALAGEAREAQLLDELRSDVVQTVVLRIQALLGQQD